MILSFISILFETKKMRFLIFQKDNDIFPRRKLYRFLKHRNTSYLLKKIPAIFLNSMYTYFRKINFISVTLVLVTLNLKY